MSFSFESLSHLILLEGKSLSSSVIKHRHIERNLDNIALQGVIRVVIIIILDHEGPIRHISGHILEGRRILWVRNDVVVVHALD